MNFEIKPTVIRFAAQFESGVTHSRICPDFGCFFKRNKHVYQFPQTQASFMKHKEKNFRYRKYFKLI